MHFSATEIEGEGEPLPAPAGSNFADEDPTTLQEINFDDGMGIFIGRHDNATHECSEDQTNLHRHARFNAQEAISLAKQRAEQFDTQAALERKANEALKLSKERVHLRDVEDQPSQNATSSTAIALVDCESSRTPVSFHPFTGLIWQWILTN